MEDSNNPKLGTLVFEFDQTHTYSCCDFYSRRFQIVSGENSFNVYQNGGSIKNKRKKNVGSVPYFLAKSTEKGSTLAGSCHGVVCLYDVNIRDGVVLWNPATRQSKLLPKPWSQNRYLNRNRYSGAQYGTTPEIQVYRQSTDSWSWIDSDFSSAKCCVLDWSKQGRYLNGNYFCIGFRRYIQTIVSFDFNKEVFRSIPNTGDFITFATTVFQLDSIGGQLACIEESNRFEEPNCLKTFEVWVLNDFNATEENYSWTILPINMTVGCQWGFPGIDSLVLFLNLRTRNCTILSLVKLGIGIPVKA
ncbi:uncharacterized protein LOC113326487 [Papaver somniferum]|uniref:uncharacterized protein LOC113326487 n=1 Tax=Papaver somniferum TaxID=3469 RepID=UPI000E6F6A5A|nr:uncharacterized protein LOC113326487 [Papaver somniferum]